jgi:HSP20 family molecular chaperone IbpA
MSQTTPQDAVLTARPVRELRPRVDVYENTDELLLLADMPGAGAKSVNIQFEDGQLTMTAERVDANDQPVRYHRAFQLPDTIDPDKISAELKHGVLHVHLPKAERAKPRTIAIRAA